MKQATHFIEVWKTSTGTVVTEGVSSIVFLEHSLNATKATGKGAAKTIAIFKVYPKKSA